MRYTEARLSHAAALLLEDLKLDTVDFIPTYDEARTEPVVLPSKFPNLLVNGATGIAVGMATSIPPHNLREVCSALVKLSMIPRYDRRNLRDHPWPGLPEWGHHLRSLEHSTGLPNWTIDDCSTSSNVDRRKQESFENHRSRNPVSAFSRSSGRENCGARPRATNQGYLRHSR